MYRSALSVICWRFSRFTFEVIKVCLHPRSSVLWVLLELAFHYFQQCLSNLGRHFRVILRRWLRLLDHGFLKGVEVAFEQCIFAEVLQGNEHSSFGMHLLLLISIIKQSAARRRMDEFVHPSHQQENGLVSSDRSPVVPASLYGGGNSGLPPSVASGPADSSRASAPLPSALPPLLSASISDVV